MKQSYITKSSSANQNFLKARKIITVKNHSNSYNIMWYASSQKIEKRLQ